MHRYPFHISLMLSFNFSRVNISMGPLEERMMLSGMHTVADIFCCCCGQNVGWKYISLTSRFFGSGFLFLTLFLSLFGRNQRMRKNRNIKKANLFWKGNQLLLWKVSVCPIVHSFSHKLGVLLQSFSEEGSWMKHQQRFASILEARQKILKMSALDSSLALLFLLCVE